MTVRTLAGLNALNRSTYDQPAPLDEAKRTPALAEEEPGDDAGQRPDEMMPAEMGRHAAAHGISVDELERQLSASPRDYREAVLKAFRAAGGR